MIYCFTEKGCIFVETYNDNEKMNTAISEILQSKDLRIKVLEEQLTACKSDRKRLKNELKLHIVSQKKELLIAWEKRGYGKKEWELVEEIKIEFINNFLINL